MCTSHNAIADFRAKLLALLPIASAAGILTAVETLSARPGSQVLIGVFGVLITCGLLLYELRGIEDCTMLRYRARAIEKRLGVTDEESQFGAYGYCPPKFGIVDEIGAGLVVYFTVMAGWAALAAKGIRQFYHTGIGGYVAIAVLYGVSLTFALWNRDKLVYRSPVH